jgi:hypothetical protein
LDFSYLNLFRISDFKKPQGLTNAHGLTIEYDEHGKPVRFTGTSDPQGIGLAEGLAAK